MYKNYLKTLGLSLVTFLGFNATVNAYNIYDYIEPNDVIIGNTTFRSGTWISANRASKAGSLYTLDSGDTDVKTYKYITEDLWYELVGETDEYRKLDEEEVLELEESLGVYYENNEPMLVTFEYDPGMYLAYLFEEADGVTYNTNDVIVNTDENTVTCPYGTVNIISQTTEYGSGDFYLECKDSLNIEREEQYFSKSIEIVSVSVPEEVIEYSENIEWINNPTFNNQDKFSVEYSSGERELIPGKYNSVRITFEDKIDINSYLVFDIEFNDPYALGWISLYISNDNNIKTWMINDSTMRVAIFCDYFESVGETITFLDNVHNDFIKLYITSNYLERIKTDLSIDVELASFEGDLAEIAVNQNKNIEMNFTESEGFAIPTIDWDIISTSELSSFEYKGEVGKWVAFEMNIPEELYLEKTFVNISNWNVIGEIINNKYVLWLDLGSGIELNQNFDSHGTLGIKNDYIDYDYISSVNYYISYRSYNEENSISFDFNNKTLYYVNRVDNILEETDNSSNNYLYYDKGNNKIYYFDVTYIHNVIYKDEDSIKQLYYQEEEVKTFEIIGYTVIDDYVNLLTSDAHFNGFVNAPEMYNETYHPTSVHYFFNREKTSEELEAIEAFEALRGTYGTEVVDDSALYYGEVTE